MKKNIILLFTIILSLVLLLPGCNAQDILSSDRNNSSTSSNENNYSQMKVHFIDVGQGDSILIQVNDKNMLIDCGPREGKDNLFNYLNKLNIKTLDYVIATHPHADHIGNMADIINKYDVKKFYSPKVQTSTKTYEKMVDALKNKNLKINVIKAGTNIDLGDNTKIDVFSPNKDKYDNLNNYSPIMKLTYGKTSFLLTGDAETLVEKEVLTNNCDVSADVIKFGHHGSSSSSSEEFISKVNPSIGVICVGKDNDYNHPHKETLNTIKKHNITTYRTDKDGTIVLTSDGQKISK